MSPLQLSVYWRLSLLFFFTPFLFFLDVFTAAVAARTCRHDNGTESAASLRGTFPPREGRNQSQHVEASELDADWRTDRLQEETVCGWTDWLSYGQTAYMVGLLLGSLVGGAVSDRYGKRPVLLACACLHAFCGLLPAVFPQPLLFLAIRCLTAVCCCCINICAFSLGNTDVTPNYCLPSPCSAATALTYYGICLNIGSFGVGVYAAQFFSGLSEAPCLLVPLVRMGRRLICMLALFLSGSACLVSLLLSRYHGTPALVMSLALLGKLCILAATFISVLYCIELFPTVVRQRCLSLVNLSYRLGCLVTTFVPPSPTGAISLAAMVVYSSGPIVGCGLCLLLPETSGVPLPDSLEDCNRQPKNQAASFSALWRPRKTKTTEIPPPEKVDVQTPDAPFL
ncbi:PREDICTED: solute carrier family 22 member 8-like [Cyprinodon variegatus]|uniref:solute carrier family 22 member 8-like n=1 Tax=Cyprinodon variegatus TaxID=28743 RepID=UPI000742C41B|nr:PREDICTED: solute carrier family 22 member 8-like [Cyprinodon variegatus]